ncbi:MAG: flagellar type III secretion system protein FliR [Proteobacteria bacterium]|nr:flagellar type III secretion system protein FliR [Pseudomonadota bacterium]
MFGDALPVEIYTAGLVFARVGAIVMLIPGLGEAAVPPRIRLAFAFVLTLVLFPLAAPTVAAIPALASGLAGAVIKEVLIGLMIGGLLRLFLSSLAVAGEAVSLQTTLSFAQTANPLGGAANTSVGAFLGLLGVTLIFATDLHHLFIGAIARSYALFPPNRAVPLGDAGDLAIRTVGEAFALGVQLAAPVIVFSLVLNVAAGLIGRVLPQFQIFFVSTPINVLVGLSVFALSLGLIGLVWIERYEAYLQRFIGGGG